MSGNSFKIAKKFFAENITAKRVHITTDGKAFPEEKNMDAASHATHLAPGDPKVETIDKEKVETIIENPPVVEKMIKHTVTAEDLKENPLMEEEGILVGEEIEIPNPAYKEEQL